MKQKVTNTPRDHYIAVMELLDLDPLSEQAAQQRTGIEGMEIKDPTLIAQRIAIMTARVRPIGEAPLVERSPDGILLT